MRSLPAGTDGPHAVSGRMQQINSIFNGRSLEVLSFAAHARSRQSKELVYFDTCNRFEIYH